MLGGDVENAGVLHPPFFQDFSLFYQENIVYLHQGKTNNKISDYE